MRIVVFDSTPTITYNATSLILPTSANIVAAAGDVALVVAETTANARILGYWRKDGSPLLATTATNALSGSVIQTVYTQSTAVADYTPATAIPIDDSFPQQATEGSTYSTINTSITPNNSSNYLRITVVLKISSDNNENIIAALFQDSTANALEVSTYRQTEELSISTLILRYIMTAGTTSATTFKVNVSSYTNSIRVTINGINAGRLFGGASNSSMLIDDLR